MTSSIPQPSPAPDASAVFTSAEVRRMTAHREALPIYQKAQEFSLKAIDVIRELGHYTESSFPARLGFGTKIIVPIKVNLEEAFKLIASAKAEKEKADALLKEYAGDLPPALAEMQEGAANTLEYALRMEAFANTFKKVQEETEVFLSTIQSSQDPRVSLHALEKFASLIKKIRQAAPERERKLTETAISLRFAKAVEHIKKIAATTQANFLMHQLKEAENKAKEMIKKTKDSAQHTVNFNKLISKVTDRDDIHHLAYDAYFQLDKALRQTSISNAERASGFAEETQKLAAELLQLHDQLADRVTELIDNPMGGDLLQVLKRLGEYAGEGRKAAETARVAAESAVKEAINVVPKKLNTILFKRAPEWIEESFRKMIYLQKFSLKAQEAAQKSAPVGFQRDENHIKYSVPGGEVLEVKEIHERLAEACRRAEMVVLHMNKVTAEIQDILKNLPSSPEKTKLVEKVNQKTTAIIKDAKSALDATNKFREESAQKMKEWSEKRSSPKTEGL